MNFILYFFIGLITATLGALPLGTTNVAVINTTIKENIQNAFKIVYPAAVAELFLILIAVNFNMQIAHFVDMNIWLQYAIAIIMLLIGVFLYFGRKECIKDENDECIIIKKRYNISKQTLGFILGFFNPTVLIYWILIISFLNNKMIYLTVNIDYFLLALFLIGAFIGKVITLYLYGKFSHLLKMKLKNTTNRINQVIGVLLIFVAAFQFVKLIL